MSSLPARRLLTVLLAFALLVPAATAARLDGLDALPSTGDAAPGRYLVGFHEMPPLDAGDDYAGARVVSVTEGLRFAVVEPSDLALFEARAKLDGNVRYVEWEDPELARALLVPDDPLYSNAGHYGTKIIGAEAAWDRTLGSTAVKVAVIDSGLRKTHEEFAGSGRVLQGWDFVQNDNDPQDNCGHGTHVTGTIGATIHNGKGIAGLAQATLIPIRGLSATLVLCSGSTSGLANALKYAADQGAHFSSNSWGGGGATAITDAINYAHARGVVQIAAAGNDGSCTNCVSEPWRSNHEKVIVVSSTTSSDGFSSFSSQGPQVDLAAPGSSIISAYNGNDASYSTLSGTSMAAPHVTGVAALLKTLNPSWGYAEIDQRLKSTAVDLGAAGKDDRFGWGRLDAAAAVGGTAGPAPNQPPVASFTLTADLLAVAVDGRGSSDPDGSVASWAWSWGDGSATTSGATATHTYAAAGTYTVTLTVTDDDGATATASQQVSVSDGSDPDPGARTLASGEAVSATSGGTGSDQHYKVLVPAGASRLDVVLDGPGCGLLGCSADLDLYVRKGARATDSGYDCRPYKSGSDESCAHTNPGADWWYVRVKVYSGSSVAYTLRATVS